jgi:DnaJ-class molecular chaperone
MKSKKEKFVCSCCDGDGWVTEWRDNKKTKKEDFVLKDCDACDGKGYIFVEVIDERIVTAKKKANYIKEY